MTAAARHGALGSRPDPAASAGALEVDIRVERAGFAVTADFTVHPGQRLALMGPNGAGKSTLVAAVAGLVPVAAGRIRLGDRTLTGPDSAVPPESRRIGVLFQDLLLFPHLTVLDNVAFAERMRARPRAGAGTREDPGRGPRRRARARAAARPWLDRFELSDLADRLPGQLSGGQRQRVALARVLASDPAALLLDEPLAALDLERRDEVRADLAAHLAEIGLPTVVVTHDSADVAALAQQVLVIEAGRITQRGTPAELRDAPATPYIDRIVRT